MWNILLSFFSSFFLSRQVAKARARKKARNLAGYDERQATTSGPHTHQARDLYASGPWGPERLDRDH